MDIGCDSVLAWKEICEELQQSFNFLWKESHGCRKLGALLVTSLCCLLERRRVVQLVLANSEERRTCVLVAAILFLKEFMSWCCQVWKEEI
jgi:hypothetical protein